MNPIFPGKLITFAAALLLHLSLSACGDVNRVGTNASPQGPVIPSFQALDGNQASALPSAASDVILNGAALSSNGRFELSFGSAASAPGSTSVVNNTRAVQIERQLTPSILAVNDLISLPGGNIPIIVRQCELANAFYVSTVPEIVMCTELLDASYTALLGLFDGDIARASRVAGQVFTFFMLHEIAHALDHVLELPVFGNTESAADAIATVLAAESGTPDIVLFAAYLFTLSVDGTFGDVHHSGEDRAGDLVCWVLGSTPELMEAEALSGLGQQFVDAGRDCVGEYAAQRTAVERWIPRLRDLAGALESTQPRTSQEHQADAERNLSTILYQLNLLL